MSLLEKILASDLKKAKIDFEEQKKGLVPGRRFVADFFCKPDLVIEVQGGLRMAKSGHNTHSGITRDCIKGNLLVLQGYRVLHVTSDHVKSGDALKWIVEALKKSRADWLNRKLAIASDENIDIGGSSLKEIESLARLYGEW